MDERNIKKTCVRSFERAKTVEAWSNGDSAYTAMSEWMPVAGVDSVDLVVDARNVTDLAIIRAYQLAAVRTDRPDDWSTFVGSSTIDTDDVTFERLSLTSDNDSHTWIRFGLAFRADSPATFGRADVWLYGNCRAEGQLVAARTFQINPTGTSGATCYLPVGGFVPTTELSKVQAAFQVMDESGNFEYQLAIRTANDRRAPNAWTNLEASFSTPSNPNEERQMPAIDPDTKLGSGSKVSENGWFQLGVAYKGTTGRVTLRALVLAVRS